MLLIVDCKAAQGRRQTVSYQTGRLRDSATRLTLRRLQFMIILLQWCVWWRFLLITRATQITAVVLASFHWDHSLLCFRWDVLLHGTIRDVL